MNMPMKKGQGLNWDPASVELPEIPTIQPGQDALSATIAAVLPTLAVPLAANVATLQAKEGMFAGKLGAAETAYSNSDDQGGQAVGQVVGMLGQLGQQAGQMGQMAGAPAQALGGQTGMFGSLMQQAMKGAEGGGAGGGQQAPAPGGVAPSPGAPASQQQPSEEKPAEEREEHEEREPLLRADDSRPGPVPVTQPEPSRHSDDDLGRRL